MLGRITGLVIALTFALVSDNIPRASAQSNSPEPCCADPWNPGGMHRDKWGHGNMGSEQRQRMLRHWAFMNEGVPAEYRGARSPLGQTTVTVDAGGRLYADSCAACHGATGLGDGEAGRSLTPSPALLAYLIRMPMMADEYLLWAISEGGAPFDTDMPAFKDTLSRDEIWQITAYMRAGFPKVATTD